MMPPIEIIFFAFALLVMVCALFLTKPAEIPAGREAAKQPNALPAAERNQTSHDPVTDSAGSHPSKSPAKILQHGGSEQIRLKENGAPLNKEKLAPRQDTKTIEEMISDIRTKVKELEDFLEKRLKKQMCF